MRERASDPACSFVCSSCFIRIRDLAWHSLQETWRPGGHFQHDMRRATFDAFRGPVNKLLTSITQAKRHQVHSTKRCVSPILTRPKPSTHMFIMNYFPSIKQFQFLRQPPKSSSHPNPKPPNLQKVPREPHGSKLGYHEEVK